MVGIVVLGTHMNYLTVRPNVSSIRIKFAVSRQHPLCYRHYFVHQLFAVFFSTHRINERDPWSLSAHARAVLDLRRPRLDQLLHPRDELLHRLLTFVAFAAGAYADFVLRGFLVADHDDKRHLLHGVFADLGVHLF